MFDVNRKRQIESDHLRLGRHKSRLGIGQHKERRNLELFLLTLPVVLYVLIFNYLPMGGVIVAFKNYNYAKGIFGSDWVGFKNFEYFFRSKAAAITTLNTLFYNICFITFGTIISVLVAMLLNEIRNKASIKFYQTVMFFPQFLSWIVVAFILYAFLGSSYGIVNQIFTKQGLEMQNWYHYPDVWPGIIITTALWKSLGMSVLISYAALLGIDKSYYEAASIDGANKFQMAYKISLPFIIPINVIQIILAVGKIFNADFGMFYQLTQNSSSLETTTAVIDTYVFRLLMESNEIGIATAVGLYQSVVGLILVIVVNSIVNKIQPESTLF